ncbi:type III polyketide synthase [Cellulomonas fimi]|uniref:Type III polyketide synthase n=1 Tax=Cellulomonas fimi TaxID=1708 RepID=A0A7Y0LZX1_CELFI|nr:3-oxoacyl-[acyl-carrier-protein] synthase III C-terminal domain-containing protein [Cellulomonas fimi]NMR21278.1 type III polyketide synthase [Cellulomonas fimi]
MSRIAAVAPVLPELVYAQHEITATLASLLVGDDARRQAVLERLHASAGVRTRHLALPLDRYRELDSFGATNDLFIQIGTDLAERALRAALRTAGVMPDEVDLIVFTSVTGISAPSIDALLVPRIGLRPDVKRVPMFGLGCVAGAAGIARVHDYLTGHPGDVAVLVSVELCSLTMQADDASMANLVSTGLFGDGASAVVMVGDERARATGAPGPDVVATRSRLYADTEDALGWDIGASGFRIVLSAGLADVVEEHLGHDVADLLAAHELKTGDIPTWVAHTGGPKILEAASRSMDLPAGAFERSWSSLARVGNLSSSGVLHVLADTLDAGGHEPGAPAVLFALGPGVCAEIVLLRWPGSTATATATTTPRGVGHRVVTDGAEGRAA